MPSFFDSQRLFDDLWGHQQQQMGRLANLTAAASVAEPISTPSANSSAAASKPISIAGAKRVLSPPDLVGAEFSDYTVNHDDDCDSLASSSSFPSRSNSFAASAAGGAPLSPSSAARRERNRQAAERCRKKKQALLEAVQAENAELVQRVVMLEAEVVRLRQALAAATSSRSSPEDGDDDRLMNFD